MIIKNGNVVLKNSVEKKDILIENGKIKEIGQDLSISEGVEVLDATGKEVYPGFVEAHSHIGLCCYGTSSKQHNELNDVCSPQLRAIDGVDPMDEAFETARNAGVTCVCTGPGSRNVLGGTFTALKTVGRRVDNMIVKKKLP